MATYKCLADLQGKTLRYADTVILKDIKYSVKSQFLQEKNYADNSEIFQVLSIPSKEELAKKAYGYEQKGGDWPECEKDDYAALTRLVIELYKIIEGKTSTTFKEEQWYKITTPGKTGISPEQVKELIVKYEGKIDPAYHYDSPLGIYYWKKGQIVDVGTIVPKDAIEVSPTTEITIIKQKEKHENQFQRKKACIERGTRPEGSTVCGRRSKASIAVGHLGYRKVTGI